MKGVDLNLEDDYDEYMKQLFANVKEAIDVGIQKSCLDDLTRTEKSSLPHCILVEGPTGVGKSRFGFLLSQKWKKSEILQHYDLVILLSYNTKQTVLAKSLKDVMYVDSSHSIIEQIMAVANNNLGYRCLIILDDIEQATHDERTLNHPLELILRHHSLPHSTVLVLVRSYDVHLLPERFLQRIDQHIIINGFTPNQVKHRFPVEMLRSNVFVKFAVITPLFTAMLNELSSFYGNSICLPTNCTELYVNYVAMVKEKYCGSSSVQKIAENSKKLNKLAKEGLETKRYKFHSGDPNVPFVHFGLLEEVDEGELYFRFIHPTIQEFLAAVDLQSQLHMTSIELPSLVIDIFNSLMKFTKTDKKYCNWMTLCFLIGLNKLKEEQLKSVFMDLVNRRQCGEIILHDWFDIFLAEITFEANDPQLFSLVFHDSEFVFKSPMNALQAYICGFAIAHSHETAVWDITLDYLTIDQIAGYREGLKTNPLCCPLNLFLNKSNINSEKEKMFDLLEILIKNCISLNISETCSLQQVSELIMQGTKLKKVHYFSEDNSLQFHITYGDNHLGVNTNAPVLQKYFSLLDPSSYNFSFICKKDYEGDIEFILQDSIQNIMSFSHDIHNLTIFFHKMRFPVSIIFPPGNKLENILLIGGPPVHDDSNSSDLFCQNLQNVCLCGFYWPTLIEGNVANLTTLTISCHITDSDSFSLSHNFISNPQCKLTTFRLFCEDEHIDTVTVLFRSLPNCNSLESFFYSGKNLKKNGVTYLAECAFDTPNLKELAIIDNTIGNYGVDLLARMVKNKCDENPTAHQVLTLHSCFEEYAKSTWQDALQESLQFSK